MEDSNGTIYMSLVKSKIHIAPIKRIRAEWSIDTIASAITLALQGARVSQIMELVPASCWGHIVSEDNSADCA
jgi:hypothetical protein